MNANSHPSQKGFNIFKPKTGGGEGIIGKHKTRLRSRKFTSKFRCQCKRDYTREDVRDGERAQKPAGMEPTQATAGVTPS